MNRPTLLATCLVFAFIHAAPVLHAAAEPADVKVSQARDVDGVRVHDVTSPFQAGTTTVRVLLPSKLEPGKRYPAIYVLPVEARDERRFGDGLSEVRRLDLHNRRQAVFVAPTFSHLPWYADHPTDPLIRQERYFLEVVLPLVETRYPVRDDAAGRLLLGFSKSGWGAFTLLLRHPDRFGRAVAWDAPLMMDRPGKYGSGDVFATQESFDRYRVTTLLESRAADLRRGRRLILLGYGNFRDHHQQAHALMDRLGVVHDYRDGPARKHAWESGWLPEAVERLLAP